MKDGWVDETDGLSNNQISSEWQIFIKAVQIQ